MMAILMDLLIILIPQNNFDLLYLRSQQQRFLCDSYSQYRKNSCSGFKANGPSLIIQKIDLLTPEIHASVLLWWNSLSENS